MGSIIKIEDLYKRNPDYNKDPKKRELLLEGFGAEFPRGKVSLIIGENGCGKSTLLNCISGLTQFERGKITVSGTNINYQIKEFSNASQIITNRHNLGIIFQQKALWEQYTVINNVIHALRNTSPKLKKYEADAKARILLQKLGIKENLFNAYPANISGGEQRKVAVARTLITDPEILFIDELEANLDLGALEDILRVLRDDYLEINNKQEEKSKSLIIISHRIDLIELKFAPEIFLIADGKLLIHAPTFSALQTAKKDNPDVASFIKNVIDPARSQWYFGTSCLQTAKEISKLIIEDTRNKIGEEEMLQKVGQHLFELITKLEPDEGHLLMILTIENIDNKEINRIRSLEITNDIKDLKLDGKDISQLCKKIREFKTIDNFVNINLRKNYKTILKNEVCEFDDKNSGVEISIKFSTDIFYQATQYHEKIHGCKKIQPEIDKNQSIELCKQTKTVYLVTIKDDDEVLGVISIDTTSSELWSNIVMEQFVLVANMAAIAIKQSKKIKEDASK